MDDNTTTESNSNSMSSYMDLARIYARMLHDYTMELYDQKWSDRYSTIITRQDLEQVNCQIVHMEFKQEFVRNNQAIAGEYTRTHFELIPPKYFAQCYRQSI